MKEKLEVKREMKQLGLIKAVASLSTSQYFNPEKADSPLRFTLDLKNSTFRHILNEIVKAEGTATWVYTEKHCGNEINFSLFLSG